MGPAPPRRHRRAHRSSRRGVSRGALHPGPRPGRRARDASAGRSLPPRTGHAQPRQWRPRQSSRASDDRGDTLPRDGYIVLAGEGGGGASVHPIRTHLEPNSQRECPNFEDRLCELVFSCARLQVQDAFRPGFLPRVSKGVPHRPPSCGSGPHTRNWFPRYPSGQPFRAAPGRMLRPAVLPKVYPPVALIPVVCGSRVARWAARSKGRESRARGTVRQSLDPGQGPGSTDAVPAAP